MTHQLLQLSNATIKFGGVPVLSRVSISLSASEIVAVLGPNGAGKSTLLKALVGLVPLRQGHLVLHGQQVKPRPHAMVRRGVAYVPQEHNTFLNMTVAENLAIGAGPTIDRVLLHDRMGEIFKTFSILAKKQHMRAKSLSGGQRQQLAIARGLMSQPSVLLLDEPSAGLSPALVTQMFSLIKGINKRHKTAILIVEHNISSVIKVADRAYVLDQGVLVESGPATAALQERVLKSLFGDS
ncbi:MAG: ABC transporter ATP-binding protein [bacterium]|nr:ABC transporter ATP-binding protein [bacterium]